VTKHCESLPLPVRRVPHISPRFLRGDVGNSRISICILFRVRPAPEGCRGKAVRFPTSPRKKRGEIPGFPVRDSHPTAACAAFVKESRMKFGESTGVRRKSGDLGHPPYWQRKLSQCILLTHARKPNVFSIIFAPTKSRALIQGSLPTKMTRSRLECPPKARPPSPCCRVVSWHSLMVPSPSWLPPVLA
jgi:hypothetical protein